MLLRAQGTDGVDEHEHAQRCAASGRPLTRSAGAQGWASVGLQGWGLSACASLQAWGAPAYWRALLPRPPTGARCCAASARPLARECTALGDGHG